MTLTFAKSQGNFQLEEAANKTPRSVDDMPLSYEAITLDGVRAVLRRTRPGIQVASFTLDKKMKGPCGLLNWSRLGSLSDIDSSKEVFGLDGLSILGLAYIATNTD